MNITLRYGTMADLDCLLELDDVDENWCSKCLISEEYIVAELECRLVGFLRYSLFWGKIPYMDMVRVVGNYRKQGIGTMLFKFWENEMKKKNFKRLMTSSEEDEIEPQNWHIKNGFKKCGKIDLINNNDAAEIFMIKFFETSLLRVKEKYDE